MPNNRFLVDTSAWILSLRKEFLPHAKERVGFLLQEDAVVTTGIIKLELLRGTKTDKEFRRLKTRLDALDIIETDSFLWDAAARLAFKLRHSGITVPYTDILITACALKIDATVLHADSHFDLMKKHANLKVESFVSATRGMP